MLEQVFSDVAGTHVGRGAQSRFEISVASVDGPIDQVRFFDQHCFHPGKIKVSGNHEALHTRPIELQILLGEDRNVIS